ncbi:MAG: penicillin-binding protein 2, partial [Lachnospiraceae bacterium]|nr:penicillin-binding protein 2 [Lachnospiraceae bacterium]
RNGNAIAKSIKVYNLVVDPLLIAGSENEQKYYDNTVSTIERFFGTIKSGNVIDTLKKEDGNIDMDKFRENLSKKSANKSKYWIVMKQLTYEEIEPYLSFMKSKDKEDRKISDNVAGIWFEEEYKRMYPFDDLACSVIGFASGRTDGTSIGIEAYYNDYLSGTNGRKYGYVNADNNMEGVVKDPKNGNTVISTIDINIQRIVQKKIKEYKKKFKPKRMAVVIADPNTGEILAMADDTTFNLNNPAGNGKKNSKQLNKLWRNFCVSDSFEPGSTAKPFTVAAAYEEGLLDENTTYVCDGGQAVPGFYIRCHKETGHGTITAKQAVAYSCNDALMQIGAKEGVDIFSQYQTRFGLGVKTGIDLPSETRGLIYEAEEMGPTDLATNSFGQNFTVNMIQMVAGFSSLVNGGYYYEPHVVKEIHTEEGNLVEKYSKRLVKQTVTGKTSEFIRECLRAVVTDGTGKTAAIDGYTVSGKTGTAEKVEDGTRVRGQYIISFLGAVPAEKPEVVCYTLMDSPEDDPDSTAYNTEFWSAIMKEVLPYLHVAKTEDEGKDADIKGTQPDDISEQFEEGIISGEGSGTANTEQAQSGEQNDTIEQTNQTNE